MRVPFSERPGRHERHLRRRLDRPLPPRRVEDPADGFLLGARRRDPGELIAFVTDLRNAAGRAVNPKGRAAGAGDGPAA
jgi:hypothetical protein